MKPIGAKAVYKSKGFTVYFPIYTLLGKKYFVTKRGWYGYNFSTLKQAKAWIRKQKK